MRNNQIRLTEQDLHMLVEDAVINILRENGMEEGLFGGLGALGAKTWNGVKKGGESMTNSMGGLYNRAKNAVGNAYNQVSNTVGNAYNNASTAVGKTYNNAVNTYQVGSINQDAQKAIENVRTSLTQLQGLNKKLMNMGQATVLDRNTAPLVQNLLKSLNRISGNFRSRRTSYTS
jgi:hypothetical protein